MRLLANFFKRAGIGFVIGVIMGNVIAWFTGGFFTAEFVETAGNTARAVVIQTLTYGLYGAAAMGGTVLYDIEKWPLALSSAMHYLIIAVLFVPMSLLLGWVGGVADILVMEGIELVMYFMIWLIMYLRYKAHVKELNELQEISRREKDQ